MATDPTLRRPLLAVLGALALLAGCATPTTLERPRPELPERWASAPDAEALQPGERWWTLFGDPVLTQLVDDALAANADLAIAAERIVEARARAGIADADRYPSVSAGASSTRTRRSLEGSVQQPAGTPRLQNTHQLGVEASYELDLWGRYAAASQAARAELLATEWAHRGVRLSLIADVASAYHALRAADAAEAVLHRTLAGRDDALELLGHRVRAGTASEFDLNQTRAEIVAVRAQLAGVVQQREALESRLAVLLGRSPRAVMSEPLPRGQGLDALPLQIPAGLPSELLLRRPDLRQAEVRLDAANARVDEARALLFPSISLTASVGQESASLSQLFTSGANVINLGLGLTQPIWNAGRLQDNLEASASAQRQQTLAYGQAITAAFADVRRALAAQRAARDSLDAERERASILRDTVRQSRLRFDAGVTSRLEVLDAERNLLQAELSGIDALSGQKTAVTDLVRALGGGWSPDAGEAQAASR